MELSRSLTPLELEDAARIFCEAYAAETGGSLPQNALELGLAITWGLENARGSRIIRHNWGNISAGEQWRASRDWWAMPEEHREPGQPIGFRAYDSHLEGARDWWRLILGAERYRELVRLLPRGSAAAIVEELFASGYVAGSEADADAYARGVAAIRRELAGVRCSSSGDDLAGGLALAAGVVGTAWLAWRASRERRGAYA